MKRKTELLNRIRDNFEELKPDLIGLFMFHCLKCDYRWWPKVAPLEMPGVCPKCKRWDWQKPRIYLRRNSQY